jgi:hypothetical protein
MPLVRSWSLSLPVPQLLRIVLHTNSRDTLVGKVIKQCQVNLAPYMPYTQIVSLSILLLAYSFGAAVLGLPTTKLSANKLSAKSWHCCYRSPGVVFIVVASNDRCMGVAARKERGKADANKPHLTFLAKSATANGIHPSFQEPAAAAHACCSSDKP